jgi:hypothetical protein
LRQCQQLIDAESKLKAFLAGKGAPADAATQVHMADLAQQPFNRLTLTAARLYRDAFARQPRFADALRYNAACCAALAGCGHGKDVSKLTDRDRAGWRGQALDWLRSQLTRCDKALDSPNAQARAVIVQQLRHWQRDSDLAGVREKAALDKLPQTERTAWLNLWSDIAALLARASAQT